MPSDRESWHELYEARRTELDPGTRSRIKRIAKDVRKELDLEPPPPLPNPSKEKRDARRQD